ncbi:L-histidine N(alpha)-methyltransferase [Neoroseomonas soli]|uniref:L-histidine N(Alpha)-methyltransferase n=1 Tax=Neoroseomonas soli TaxID=1081025 RepID=A0A9X9WR94_9PROT|nr:L-histidine N(alpha)-methyltransferase [Neoroseomonas soli]MBR0669673.1 L-histidine N(alpha)-methyltransferase [Neoroseomonas soli]
MSAHARKKPQRHAKADDAERSALLADALRGLAAPQKALPCKWLYDEAGAALFGEITRLPEYYPTRTERRILQDRAAEIGTAAGPGAAVVEFGSGDGEKAAILLGGMPNPAAYVPVDIAPAWLDEASRKVAAVHPRVPVLPVLADFSRPFALPRALGAARRVGFFPGSTIGNFTPSEASTFLERARRTLGDRALLVLGADLIKDRDVLIPAYDDAAGITARFNLNLLARLNRVCGADFDLAAFRHCAKWNDAEDRIEMHLIARCSQTVTLAGRRFHLAAGESIHTENSHKYDPEKLGRLFAASGWVILASWTDPDRLFSVGLLHAPPETRPE